MEDLFIKEECLYETIVKYRRVKVDMVNSDDIRVKNKIQIKNLMIIIETKDSVYQFTCKDIFEAKK